MKTKSKATSKAVEWSYASSANACEFGFSKSGCYTVTLRRFKNDIGEPVAAFATLPEAQGYANGLPYEWHNLTISRDKRI